MDGITRTSGLGLALSLLPATLACPGTSDDREITYDEGEGLGEGECADVCGTPGCGTCPTAVMVDAGGLLDLLIDATEVTNGQYAALLEVEFDAAVLPRGCEFKSGFRPLGWTDALDPELPVVGVDWCDAAVFCAWSGRALCGAIAGGPARWDTAEDPETDAWYRACSAAGERVFPHGSVYEPTICNGKDAGHELLAAGSLATCEGGVAGLFDMSGNVWEWTDSCESLHGDATTHCRRRGGSHYSGSNNLRCGVNSLRPRGERDSAVGFRCCSD
jgi:formylglycine-generating enzyme